MYDSILIDQGINMVIRCVCVSRKMLQALVDEKYFLIVWVYRRHQENVNSHVSLKGRCFHNHNKKVCYLNTESLVLNITCNDFRKRMRSKVMCSTAKIDGISYAELVANRRWIAVFEWEA